MNDVVVGVGDELTVVFVAWSSSPTCREGSTITGSSLAVDSGRSFHVEGCVLCATTLAVWSSASVDSDWSAVLSRSSTVEDLDGEDVKTVDCGVIAAESDVQLVEVTSSGCRCSLSVVVADVAEIASVSSLIVGLLVSSAVRGLYIDWRNTYTFLDIAHKTSTGNRRRITSYNFLHFVVTSFWR